MKIFGLCFFLFIFFLAPISQGQESSAAKKASIPGGHRGHYRTSTIHRSGSGPGTQLCGVYRGGRRCAAIPASGRLFLFTEAVTQAGL